MEIESATVKTTRYKKKLTTIKNAPAKDKNETPPTIQLNHYCLVIIFQYLPIFDRVRCERG